MIHDSLAYQYIEGRENNSCSTRRKANITEAIELLVDWNGCEERKQEYLSDVCDSEKQ